MQGKRRKYDHRPFIKSLPLFVTTWKNWWTGLQPNSRREGDTSWPLARVLPEDCDEWMKVNRGGCNGLFMVLMTLSWWLTEVGDGDTAEVFDAIRDVVWVCQTLAEVNKRPKHKLAEAPDVEEHLTKRRRVS